MDLQPAVIEIESKQECELGECPVLSIEQILLCTDFSPSSRGAFDAVVRLCQYTSSKVTVLHVTEFGPIPATTDEAIDYIEKLYAQENQKLRGVVQALLELGVQADGLSFDGNVVKTILQEIERMRFGLVAIGTRGTRGVERLVFGSTAEGVFRKAVCPVMTVGAHSSLSSIADQSAPVVFATNFQDDDREALNYAAAMANRLRVRLHLIHVLPFPDMESGHPAVDWIMKQGLRTLAHDGAVCQVTPAYEVLHGSDVSHAVVEYAKREKAQAIVLGVHRKSRIAAHLPPQRTDRIILTAPCPVFALAIK